MASGTPNPNDITRSHTVKPITEGEPKTPQDSVRPFKPYMEGSEPNALLNAGKSPQISPFDLAHGRVPAPGPNFNTIQEQAKAAHSTLGDISNQLKTPKLKLKQSTKYLLKNKLNSAKAHINAASEKLGAPVAREEETPKDAGPLQKFLGLVTNGQNQLEETQQKLGKLSSQGDELRPGEMLLVQLKLNKAQQELEYSSLLLGKAVDDLKMMMNIQL
ncbi:MAG: hypothetical protein P0S96_01960 [Simkaniaceae bacterium]|nr:hypothetical protein [Candidatus Sacchlamyda saccharinae]